MLRTIFLTHSASFLGLRMGTMDQALLHLVDRRGQTLPGSVRLAVEPAHRWVRREYPHLDEAVIAGWAEDVGQVMGARLDEIHSPHRYAYSALHGKVREWFRTCAAREFTVGTGSELEGVGRSGSQHSARNLSDHSVRAAKKQAERTGQADS